MTDWNVRLLPVFDDNYIFLLQNDSAVIVIDPGEAKPVLQVLQSEKLSLAGVLITHHHHDHIDGLNELRVYNPELPIWAPLKNRGQIPGASTYVEEGDCVELAGLKFQVIELPGHTLGHIAYYNPQQGFLFSGDVLFGLGCGRIFEGTFEQHYKSLQRIAALPINTQVFCTHEYTEANLRFLQSLGPLSPQQQEYARRLAECRAQNRPSVPLRLIDELQCNPFLLSRNLTEFTQLRQKRNQFSS